VKSSIGEVDGDKQQITMGKFVERVLKILCKKFWKVPIKSSRKFQTLTKSN
jgi:hypothetical protein